MDWLNTLFLSQISVDLSSEKLQNTCYLILKIPKGMGAAYSHIWVRFCLMEKIISIILYKTDLKHLFSPPF